MKIIRLKYKDLDVPLYEYKSPIGYMLITADNDNKYITSIDFSNSRYIGKKSVEPKIIKDVKKELDEYFNGSLKVFTIPLALYGTDFQFSVWKETAKIPFGKVATYGEIAKMVSPKKGSISRAVGLSENRNPISLIIPCHRVVGANYFLTGYGGGISKKEYLLKHEGFTIVNSKILSNI